MKTCPVTGSRFFPSLPLDGEGQPRVPTWGAVLHGLFRDRPAPTMQAPLRQQFDLPAIGPLGHDRVVPGNQWPEEVPLPYFSSFAQLSGPDKLDALWHYTVRTAHTGALSAMGQHGITANPQVLFDVAGMGMTFEPSMQRAALIPREKNMHDRGVSGRVRLVPSRDPANRVAAGLLASGGVGDFRMSLGAGQDTNVVGAALGIPLGPNPDGVESANLLMLTGPGSQTDTYDFFGKPLSTRAEPDAHTPARFKALNWIFGLTAESGVRPAHHIFRYHQDGSFDATAPIADEVRLVPNPELSTRWLAPLGTLSVDGVGGGAIREKHGRIEVRYPGSTEPLKVVDVALDELRIRLPRGMDYLPPGEPFSVRIRTEGSGFATAEAWPVRREAGDVILRLDRPSDEARKAIYLCTDVRWEIARRIRPSMPLYRVDVVMNGVTHEGVADVVADSGFIPSWFGDHVRHYGHTEREGHDPAQETFFKRFRG